MFAGRDREGLRERSRLDARPTRGRVDLDAAHPLRLQEQRVPAPVDRARVVAAGIEGDAKAVLGGKADGGHDIVGRLGVDDGDRPLVDREIPRLPRGVPGFVARQHDIAGEAVT